MLGEGGKFSYPGSIQKYVTGVRKRSQRITSAKYDAHLPFGYAAVLMTPQRVTPVRRTLTQFNDFGFVYFHAKARLR